MTNPTYSMITVARCGSAFTAKALEHLGGLCAQLKADANALMTRYGVIATGEHTGSLVLLQGYADIGGIDAAFGVYGKSADYKALGAGDLSVTLRNVLRSEPITAPAPSDAVPKYGVLTRWTSDDPMVADMDKIVPVFSGNGAMAIRYYTIMTGSHAGRRLLAVGYPSMDAIEKTYDALMKNDDYKSAVAKIDINFRNIVRVSG